MAEIEPPSFSLGLDFNDDVESEPRIISPQQHQHSTPNPPPDPTSTTLFHDNDDKGLGPQVMDSEEEEQKEEEEELGPQVMDSDPEPGAAPSRILKRLRRGLKTEKSTVKNRAVESVHCENGDDDIEEFSSQEDVFRGHPSTQYNFACSSSKVSVHGHGVLIGKSSSQWKKKDMVSDAPASSSLDTGCSGLMFPKLTVSPLRRFQLVDSDSEEPSICGDVSKQTQKIDPSFKEQVSTISEHKSQMLVEKYQNKDLWQDFCPIKSFHVPTPVLDEVCEEYFRSIQDKNATEMCHLSTSANIRCLQDANSTAGFEQCWNLTDSLPPSHQYFCHDDLEVRKLVRNRLPNFSPLGVVNNLGIPQPSESVIDYRSQFKGEASKQKGTRRNNSKESLTRERIKTQKSNAKEVSNPSQGWVNTKSSIAIPKDAGKRRVHANGHAAGHWYTSQDGRKVYVSRSGQELTGQIAYRHYRKDNGGFRKLKKKKTNAKRKKG